MEDKKETGAKYSKGGIAFLEHSDASTPNIIEQDDKDFVWNGNQNRYFDDIVEIYNTSPTVNGIVNELSRVVYGKGLAILDDDGQPVEFNNRQKGSKVMDKINELIDAEDLKRIVFDRILLSQAAAKVIYKGKGEYKKVEKIAHWPVISLAPKKMTLKDTKVSSYYWYPDWKKYEEGTKLPPTVPAFGTSPEAEVEFKINRPYCPGYHYWSPLEWSGGIDAAIVEADIWKHHLTSINTGFTPRMIVNINRSTDTEEERETIARSAVEKFTGTEGSGIMVSVNEIQGEEASVTAIPAPDAPSHFEHLAMQCPRVIGTSFRLNNPKLMGLQTDGEGGLGNNAKEIEVADDLLNSHVIEPFQNDIVENMIKPILKINGIEENIGFIRVTSLDFDKYKDEEKELMGKGDDKVDDSNTDNKDKQDG